MSVRGTLGGVLASVAVLVVGWQIGAAALGHPTATTATSGTASGGASGVSSGTGTSGSSSSSSSSSASSSGSGLKDGSYTGKSVQTQYGEIQVAVTVSGGKITDVTTPTLQAYDGRSQRINSQAAPMLKQEVLQAQSAKVSMISGATYTSEGYLTSLQSALDQAA
ncbi:FMN-binding protein [Pseudolysinimonas sp.]|uniref:FMN-binding protein n=1 Tax=Pseudolysinimonas sp. TaxID=2680009 RepID=UPI003F7ECE76